MMAIKRKKERRIALLLYVVMVLFFVVVIFGLTASGEDTLQGAGRLRNGEEINVMVDLETSFKNNGRLTDMYAWSVIDLFDYQFRFGVDLIFRLFDLAMVCGMFYLMTYLALGRKPQLKIRDALVSLVLFVMVILTPHGRVLYAGFSTIHNYMIGAFIFLAFVLPYAMMISGRKVEEKWWKSVGMVALGIVFGMSAALTPIAFLVVAIGYSVINWKKYRLPVWAIMGMMGVVAGVLVSNILGPGAGNYANNEIYINAYDYVAFGELFSNIPRIIVHLASNSGRVMLPAVGLAGILLVCCDKPKQFFIKKFYKEMNKKKVRLMVVGLAFVVILIMGSFQVNAPLRILFPAYIVLIAEVLMLFWPYVKRVKILGWGIVGLAVGVLVVKTVLTVNYYEKSARVFDFIKNVDGDTVCVDRGDVKAFNFPVVYLGQEDMLAEWGMPELVYGKVVSFCDGE